jgi:hypothetical protein
MLCSQEVPSVRNETARTIHARGPPGTGWCPLRCAIAIAMDTQPSIGNDAIAATKDQRILSRPWPRGAAFRKGREVAAWLGIVPRQYSTGGKAKLLGISKRGNVYLRKILIHGGELPC